MQIGTGGVPARRGGTRGPPVFLTLATLEEWRMGRVVGFLGPAGAGALALLHKSGYGA